MEIDPNIIIPAAMVLAGSGGAAWFTITSTNRKTSADTGGVIIESANRVVTLQNEAIERLSAECEALRKDMQIMRDRLDASDRARDTIVLHVSVLERAITDMGGVLPPRPF